MVGFREIAMLKSSSYTCSRCNKTFASPQSLWNHKQRCRGPTVERKGRPNIEHKKEIPTFDGSEFGTGKPISKETMDKLRRHVLGDEAMAVEPPPPKIARTAAESKSQIVNSILDNPPSQQKPPTNEIVTSRKRLDPRNK